MFFNLKYKISFLSACFIAAFSFCAYAQEVPESDLSAQPLERVLVDVYQTHPAIKASKAELFSTMESVSRALSNYRPSLSAGASATTQITEPSTFGSPGNDQQNVGISLSQPLYRGGRTSAAVKAAENRVEAAKASFVGDLQSVFLEVVSAYVDVLRNRRLVELRTNNERVLETELEAAKARFDLGDVTRTDVSQAVSRLSAATAERVSAEGALQTSLAEYERVTGRQAEDLIPPAPLNDFWRDREALIQKAMDIHPDLVAARAIEAASNSDAREILGQLLPEVSLNGSINRDYNPTFGTSSYIDNSRLTLDATIPLYLGGAARAQYRQSKYQRKARAYERRDIARFVRENIISAWENMVALKAQIRSRQAQVEATELAFEGVTEESRLGSRTTLDVLDAEQERLNARVNLVSAEYDVTLAQYQLLAAAGMLTPNFLGIQGVGNEIQHKYTEIRNDWFGFSINEE